MITFQQDRLVIDFRTFDLQSYDLFLRTKKLPETEISFDEQSETYRLTAPARFAPILGIEHPRQEKPELPLAEYLFDYQRYIVAHALASKRYAIWADCGLGKCPMALEWARHVMHRTGGKVLYFTLSEELINQVVEESQRFYGESLPLKVISSRAELIEWAAHGSEQFAICTPHKMIAGVINELRHLAGVVLDESSLLKSGGGVIKWNLIKSCRGIEYKLSCTATPAPNDTMEYASQAAFLEKLRTEGEILWTYFQRDKAGNWRVKPHAQEAFYKFMSDWSIYLRSPSRYGWTDNMKDVPQPVVFEHKVEATFDQVEWIRKLIKKSGSGVLFADGEKLGVTERTKLSEVAKGFIYTDSGPIRVSSNKPAYVAAKIREELAAGNQTLIWTVFDTESEIIKEHFAEDSRVAILTGKTSKARRVAILDDFRHGKIQALISKGSMLGFGLNFPFCGAMIFSGWNDSYEQWYQEVRRAYRYGQTKALRIHIPYVAECEGMIYENILRKKAQFERDTAIQEENYIKAMRS